MQKDSKVLRMFKGRSLFFWVGTSVALVGVLGLVDYLTGNEFSISLFYLLPISLAAWYTSRTLGISIAVLSIISWTATDYALGEGFSHPVLYFWNTLIRFGFFAIVAYLLSELRASQKAVEALARTDHTTGLVNSGHFNEILEAQLEKVRKNKQPFTLVYLDLDNFKLVNDKFGHDEGDTVIKDIADGLKSSVRSTDIVSRLGGDEFVILFCEAGQQEAEVLMTKINDQISTILGQKYSFLTFSAGSVTYLSTPTSSAETIKVADQLMYTVKNGTKNGVRYSVYQG